MTPPALPGVYEARHAASEARLTIGKAANLRMRVKQGLVKGRIPHSAGDKIRKAGRTDEVVVRWAVTDRPAAVEEELHLRHKRAFNQLPTFTDRT